MEIEFRGALCATFDYFSRDAGRHCERWDITNYNRPGPGDSVAPDIHAIKYFDVGPEPCIVLDHHTTLGERILLDDRNVGPVRTVIATSDDVTASSEQHVCTDADGGLGNDYTVHRDIGIVANDDRPAFTAQHRVPTEDNVDAEGDSGAFLTLGIEHAAVVDHYGIADRDSPRIPDRHVLANDDVSAHVSEEVPVESTPQPQA